MNPHKRVDLNDIKLLAFSGVVCLSIIGMSNTESGKAVIQSAKVQTVGAISNATDWFAKLFDNRLDAPGTIAIGGAEGTLNTDGTPTGIYDGHTDPGNGATNKGFGSWQASPVANAVEGDAKAFERIKNNCIPTVEKQSQQLQVTLTPELVVQVCDAYIQAPLAAQDLLPNLKSCQQQGKTGSDALLCARTKSYYNPQTGALEASGFGNDIDRLTHDQNRRMTEISSRLKQFGLSDSQR